LLIAEEVGRHKTFPLPNKDPEPASYASTGQGVAAAFPLKARYGQLPSLCAAQFSAPIVLWAAHAS
jgi:hypothetical protein